MKDQSISLTIKEIFFDPNLSITSFNFKVLSSNLFVGGDINIVSFLKELYILMYYIHVYCYYIICYINILLNVN